MKLSKTIYGLFGAILGYIIFVLFINMMSKPSNTPLTFDPLDSLENYLFAFAWPMGNLGYVLAGALFIAYLALFYFLGHFVYNRTHTSSKG